MYTPARVRSRCLGAARRRCAVTRQRTASKWWNAQGQLDAICASNGAAIPYCTALLAIARGCSQLRPRRSPSPIAAIAAVRRAPVRASTRARAVRQLRGREAADQQQRRALAYHTMRNGPRGVCDFGGARSMIAANIRATSDRADRSSNLGRVKQLSVRRAPEVRALRRALRRRRVAAIWVQSMLAGGYWAVSATASLSAPPIIRLEAPPAIIERCGSS